MDKKLSQSIMVWLMPVIIVGGMFFAPLGYIVFLMMLFFLTHAYFKGRFWCSHLCPRGAFLDLVLSRLSLKNKIPVFFHKSIVRWSVFGVFMLFFILQFIYWLLVTQVYCLKGTKPKILWSYYIDGPA